MAKKILIVVAMMVVAALTVTACGGNSEQEIFDEAMRQIEEAMGIEIPIIDLDTTAEGERGEAGEYEEPTRIITTANLGLPIIVQERTVFSSFVKITTDGTLLWFRNIDGQNQWTTIDTNVRSFVRGVGRHTFHLYIKEDNSLWGIGSNANGVLGDGTGVDRDEPVHILDNVASVYIFGDWIFALQTDKTLLSWGSANNMFGGGSFYPVPIADDVVRVIGLNEATLSPPGLFLTFQTSTGYVFRHNMFEYRGSNELSLALPEAVRDVSPMIARVHNLMLQAPWIDYINAENTLMRQHIIYQMPMSGFVQYMIFNFCETEEIATDVVAIFSDDNGLHTFFIKADGTLWGMGNNGNGELGDGTRVPRLSPVHIADNVVYARAFAFLKQDGTFWTWNQNDPTPQLVHENVVSEEDGIFLFNDGRLVYRAGWNERVLENVKVPRTITFE